MAARRFGRGASPAASINSSNASIYSRLSPQECVDHGTRSNIQSNGIYKTYENCTGSAVQGSSVYCPTVPSPCSEAHRTVSWTPQPGSEGRTFRVCSIAKDDKGYCSSSFYRSGRAHPSRDYWVRILFFGCGRPSCYVAANASIHWLLCRFPRCFHPPVVAHPLLAANPHPTRLQAGPGMPVGNRRHFVLSPPHPWLINALNPTRLLLHPPLREHIRDPPHPVLAQHDGADRGRPRAEAGSRGVRGSVHGGRR